MKRCWRRERGSTEIYEGYYDQHQDEERIGDMDANMEEKSSESAHHNES